jgi:DNA-binding LacI/PurR family transcriptional regulator
VLIADEPGIPVPDQTSIVGFDDITPTCAPTPLNGSGQRFRKTIQRMAQYM